ncbi:DMT family transporter [Synechococcus sp. CBW1107]|uniref:DMT family transporter n=1 Tax=Synechococcus sp. CBW1107 TaxID=2789857 RepID=UPI0018CDCAB7|nr:DMT family transporter [Synechococcus sp. CBW1107]QPN57089.1 DMT family transporter [Synechococcus sp. CBW1107]CAK6694430.1 Pseudopaline exporter CntI [Synechococcus sp. CBW1107]
MVASALAFSLMGVCVKALGGRLPVAEVVLARAVVSVLISWWMLRRAGLHPWGQRRRLLVGRGILGTAGLYCVYLALIGLPLAVATVLQYLHPTFTALLAWPLLAEKPGWRVWGAVLLGFLGVVVLAAPGGVGAAAGAGLPALPLLFALAGALLSALAYVSVRALRSSEHPLVVVFYFPLMALPLSLPLVLLWPVAPTVAEFGWLLGVGVFTQLGQIALTYGLMGMAAARATAISYVQVPFSALWGVWWFGEAVPARAGLSALLVLLATLLSLRARPAPAASDP